MSPQEARKSVLNKHLDESYSDQSFFFLFCPHPSLSLCLSVTFLAAMSKGYRVKVTVVRRIQEDDLIFSNQIIPGNFCVEARPT